MWMKDIKQTFHSCFHTAEPLLRNRTISHFNLGRKNTSSQGSTFGSWSPGARYHLSNTQTCSFLTGCGKVVHNMISRALKNSFIRSLNFSPLCPLGRRFLGVVLLLVVFQKSVQTTRGLRVSDSSS